MEKQLQKSKNQLSHSNKSSPNKKKTQQKYQTGVLDIQSQNEIN